MSIEKKLIYCETRAQFDIKNTAGEFKNSSVVFIKSTGELWTHGKFFGGAFSSATSDKVTIKFGDTAYDIARVGHTHAFSTLTGITYTNEFNILSTTSAYADLHFNHYPLGSRTALATPITNLHIKNGATGYAYVIATGYKTPSGTAAQFLKANGTIDNNIYVTSDGTINGAVWLRNNEALTYGASGVNYFNKDLIAGAVAKVNDGPTSSWWHIMRFNHGNIGGYYTDLAVPFNQPSLYYKNIQNGGVQYGGWIKVLDTQNYAVTLNNIYVRQSGDTMTGKLVISTTAYQGQLEIKRADVGNNSMISYSNNLDGVIGSIGVAGSNDTVFGRNPIFVAGPTTYKIWHQGNDGAGSGLDADLLQGAQPSEASGAGTIVKRNIAGQLFGSHYNQNTPFETEPITYIIGGSGTGNGGNGYNRKYAKQEFINQISDFEAISNTIPKRDASGNIKTNYLFTNQPGEDNLNILNVGFWSDANALRKCSLSRFRSVLNIPPVTDLSNYVTLNTEQAITGIKLFKEIAYFGTDNIGTLYKTGDIRAVSFIKHGSTSAQLLRGDGGVSDFNWSGQSGQPTWLWGGNNAHAYYLYNPSNFSVDRAIGIRRFDCENPSDAISNSTFRGINHWAAWTGANNIGKINGGGYNVGISVGGVDNTKYGFQLGYSNGDDRTVYLQTYTNNIANGWKKILHTDNWSSIVDGRYLPLTGGTMTGAITFSNGTIINGESSSLKVSTPHGNSYFGMQNSLYLHIMTDAPKIYFYRELEVIGNKVWHAGNDGVGSGLDADLVRGKVIPNWSLLPNKPSYRFDEIEQALTVPITPGSPTRTTIVNNTKSGNGYTTRIALGLSNVSNQFGPALLSVGKNDAGTLWEDFKLHVNGNLESSKGLAIFTSDCSETSIGGKVVVRNVAGDIFGRYINGANANEDGLPIASVNYGNGTDGYIRKCSLARFKQAAGIIDSSILDSTYVKARNRSNWNDSTVINNVIGLLAWRNYGNGHVIFDASAGTNPNGVACSNSTPQVLWSSAYPTLMGFNGTTTYGVRVDSARNADTVGGISSSNLAWGYNNRGHGAQGTAYTGESYYTSFINTSRAAFMERGTWDYAGNGHVTTDWGNISLAGTAITSWGDANNFTSLYISPLDSNINGLIGEMFFYSQNGASYTRGWRRVLTSANWNSIVDGRYLPLTGGNLSGPLNVTGYITSISGWFQNTIAGTGLYNSAQDARWRAQNNRWESDKAIYTSSNYIAGSTALCTNVNADLLDGYHGSDYLRSFWTVSPGFDCNTYNYTSLVSFTYSNNAPFNGAFIDVSTNKYGFYLGCGYSGNSSLFYKRHGDPVDGGMGSWQELARITDIPNPVNYYWANILVSANANSGTSPTFNTAYTSSWWRSTGSTGWYSETYGGGIYMKDSTWVRVYNGKPFFVDNTSADAIHTAGGLNVLGRGLFGTTVTAAGFVKVGSSGSYALTGDGGHLAWADGATGSTLVRRDGNGYIFAKYLNATNGNEDGIAIGSVMIKNTADTYIRQVSLSSFANTLSSMIPAPNVTKLPLTPISSVNSDGILTIPTGYGMFTVMNPASGVKLPGFGVRNADNNGFIFSMNPAGDFVANTRANGVDNGAVFYTDKNANNDSIDWTCKSLTTTTVSSSSPYAVGAMWRPTYNANPYNSYGTMQGAAIVGVTDRYDNVGVKGGSYIGAGVLGMCQGGTNSMDGSVNSTDGKGCGVFGIARNGIGVKGTGNIGVIGYSNSSNGIGVGGYSTADVSDGVFAHASGYNSYALYANSAGSSVYALYGSGKCGGSSAWFNTSDRRLKYDIHELSINEYALESIAKISLLSFRMNDTGELNYGAIAQDVAVYFPEMVEKAPRQEYYSLNYNSLFTIKIAYLEDKCKKLEARIVDLEAGITSSVESRLSDIENRLGPKQS